MFSAKHKRASHASATAAAPKLWQVQSRRRYGWWQDLSPAQLFVGSFAALILLGAVGLKLLPGLYTGQPPSWLDATYMSTSAVCITGLSVVDTASFFTIRGQLFLLLLVQLGGLGIITFTSVIIVALGRRMSLRHEVLSEGQYEVAPGVARHKLVRDVARFTFAIEAVGAVLLYLLWAPSMGWRAAAWPALFHSICAFCNAGFSTFSDSLIGFQRSPAALAGIMALSVLGSLGFLTLEELYLKYRSTRQKRTFRFSLHSRIVLVVSAALLLIGWLMFTAFEWNRTFAALPWYHKLVNGMFLSVTPRSAGFNVISYSDAHVGTNFLTILLMSVGGAPGSMAGGMKVTTLFLVLLLAWTRFRGRMIPLLWGRSVPEETMQRAVGLFVVGFAVVTGAIFLLALSELSHRPDDAFLAHMFEAVSAFNTVGLTMNVSQELSPVGRLTAVVLMFVGRVGPIAFASALVLRRAKSRDEFRYAYEDVVVG